MPNSCSAGSSVAARGFMTSDLSIKKDMGMASEAMFLFVIMDGPEIVRSQSVDDHKYKT